MSAKLDQAMRYRLIAQKLRAIADDHPEFRQPLSLTAEDYDARASTIEAVCRIPDAPAEPATALGPDDPE
jgi:hypothetical protein